MVGRFVGGERRVGFDHVVEERYGVVDGGDCGVGLEQGVVDAEVEWGFRGGDDGGEDPLGVGDVWGGEGVAEGGGFLGFLGKLGWDFPGGFLGKVMGFVRWGFVSD